MPRRTSTVSTPQTLTPVRSFQLSPAQVSLNFSPARGIDWNVHASFPVRISQARTSPAGPRGGFSWLRPPVLIRFLYMVGGELRGLFPGIPRRFSGVFRVITPWSPNASFGSPVFAWSENRRPSLEPKTICGGVFASPAQYSTPRDAGTLDGTWNTHISLPVLESRATTRP